VQDTDRGPSVALVAIDENPHCQSSPAARSPDPLFSDNTRPESPERPESPDPLERKKPPPEFAEWAMCCIHKDHAVRRTLKTILIHPRFDQVSLTVIGLNCITLALFDPLDPDCKRDKCKVVSGFEFCWTIFFTAEFFFKWLVMGFFGKGGYWEDSWNRLDFIIVVFGAFDFMPSGVEIPGTSALRTLRAIRPLRALNKFPSLRILVNFCARRCHRWQVSACSASSSSSCLASWQCSCGWASSASAVSSLVALIVNFSIPKIHTSAQSQIISRVE